MREDKRFWADKRVLAITLGMGLMLMSFPGASPAQVVRSVQHPGKIDPEQELKMKITGPFTVAIAGDINTLRPVAKLQDPDLQAAIQILRRADVAFGNMEANIVDTRRKGHGVIIGTVGGKDTAADVKAMGFSILSRANNHTGDGGLDGMYETDRLLEQEGLVTAGTGNNLDEARAAQFLMTSKGRVGLVSMFAASSVSGTTLGIPASYVFQDAQGTPGENVLRLSVGLTVSPEDLVTLRKVRDDIYSHRGEHTYPIPPIPVEAPRDRLQVRPGGMTYIAGPKTGTYVFRMNPRDEKQNLRSIRNGKEYGQFMIATIHSHENASVLQLENTSDFPPDFMVDLAHKAIDNGADVFIAHGTHLLRGIEIYRRKPIFYGMASFTLQLNQQMPALENYMSQGVDPYTTDMTEAELQWGQWGSTDFPRMNDKQTLESMVAECKYDNGQLVEVILHPLELGYGRPIGEIGTPRVATPGVAKEILDRLQNLSRPFGTEIAIEGNLGIIRLSSKSASIGK